MSTDFLSAVTTGPALLLDGAIGTELYRKGVFINRCFEEANITDPSLVENIHKSYRQAGATVITTNSWGANKAKLKGYNLDDKLVEINASAVKLAKKASQGQGFVAGSVGPLGIPIEPFGPTSYEEVREIFRNQIKALCDEGVDLIALETFSDLSELKQGILATRDVNPNIAIIAYVTMTAEGTMPLGTPLNWAIEQAYKWGANIFGLNCSVGPQPMLSALEKMSLKSEHLISIKPNAGLPRLVDGRHIYMSTPEYMAHFMGEFLQLGIKLVGGCCGTTPEHTQAMANSLRHQTSMHKEKAPPSTQNKKQVFAEYSKETAPPVPFAKKSNWSKRLAAGEHVYSVELLPPANIDPTTIIERSKKLKSLGVHGINIPDGPRASARMSAMITAVMIEQQVGIETVLHYTCRDRNLVGMQSDMLGAQAVGLRNMLLVTGDPPKIGHYPNATGVFDVDAIGLTNIVDRLNRGIDLGDRTIGTPCSLSIGVGVNPVHKDFEYEMRRFYWKLDAGAEWAITQPVFDLKALYRFLDYIDKKNYRKIPIVVGIWPLVSYRNALFMNNEVPGVEIPADIMEKMSKAKDAEEARSIGADIASQMVEEITSKVAGIQVSAPFGRIDIATKVLNL